MIYFVGSLMEALESILKQAWLDEIEVQIFSLCQKYGRLSVTGITRFLDIPRSTVHGYVEKLKKRNFLIVTKWTQGNYYSAISPDELIAILQNRKNEVDELIKKVEDIKPTILEEIQQNSALPKIKYYEGEESIGILYDKTNNGKEKCYLTDIDAIMSFMGRDAKRVAKEFAKNKWHYREILIDTPNARAYVKEKHKIVKKKNYETKFLKQIAIKSSNCLIDNVYFHIAYDERLIAVEINNPVFFSVQQMLFDALWE